MTFVLAGPSLYPLRLQYITINPFSAEVFFVDVNNVSSANRVEEIYILGM